MAISKARIQTIPDYDTRQMMQEMYAEIVSIRQTTGTNQLTPVNNQQKPATAPPSAPGISVTGANGAFAYTLTPPSSSINKTLYYQLQYSAQSNFTSGNTTISTQAVNGNIPAPGVSAYFQARCSYDQSNWSSWASAGGQIAAGLQTSAATNPNVPLNQSNYANVDSVAAGASANVRVFGSSGPGTQYPSVKGSQETIQPSATIINVPYSTNPVVALSGDPNYQVKNTLPEVFADDLTPVGAVSVVGAGDVTLPTVVPVLGAGGAIIAYNVTSQGNGITADLSFAISGPGTGATTGAQTIVNGKLISVAPGNPGSGYNGSTTVTPSGGTFTGAAGGGRAIGGNGGRFVYNDGTTA
jgi:hypothetical protein